MADTLTAVSGNKICVDCDAPSKLNNTGTKRLAVGTETEVLGTKFRRDKGGQTMLKHEIRHTLQPFPAVPPTKQLLFAPSPL